MPKSPLPPDNDDPEDAEEDCGEGTIVQRIENPPGTPGAVDDRRQASRASVAQRILFAENVEEYLTQLRAYRTSGNYRDGAQYGDELYVFVEENFADDPESSERELLLMRIVEDAAWMQYAIIEEGMDTEFQKWSERARIVYRRLNEKRQRITDEGGSAIELRRQLLVGEMKMRLQEIRLEWKRGQFFERDFEQYTTCESALFLTRTALTQDRLFCQLDADAKPLQKQMVEILQHDVEYGAAVVEIKRMIAVISGLTYVWHRDYQMQDHDGAEKTLPDDPAYAKILREVEEFLAEYTAFYRDHPEITQPPELRYAYLERIRHLKLLGKYDESIGLAARVKRQTEKGQDALYHSRILNRIGEGQIILAQKILGAERGTPEYAELVRQARAVDELLNAEPAQEDTPPPLLALKFLSQGHAMCLEGMRATKDHPTARIARDSACDAVLTLLFGRMGTGALSMTGESSKRRFIEATVQSFHDIPLKFYDEMWFFYEAPALAKLWFVAQELGMEIDIFEEIPREHFASAHRELALEYRKSRKKVPRAYYEQIAEKIRDIRALLEGWPK